MSRRPVEVVVSGRPDMRYRDGQQRRLRGLAHNPSRDVADYHAVPGHCGRLPGRRSQRQGVRPRIGRGDVRRPGMRGLCAERGASRNPWARSACCCSSTASAFRTAATGIAGSSSPSGPKANAAACCGLAASAAVAVAIQRWGPRAGRKRSGFSRAPRRALRRCTPGPDALGNQDAAVGYSLVYRLASPDRSSR